MKGARLALDTGMWLDVGQGGERVWRCGLEPGQLGTQAPGRLGVGTLQGAIC